MKGVVTQATYTPPFEESDNMKAKSWTKTLKWNNIIHLDPPRARPTKVKRG
jgi:hypothetical protein